MNLIANDDFVKMKIHSKKESKTYKNTIHNPNIFYLILIMLKFIASFSFVLVFLVFGSLHAFAFAQTIPAAVKPTFEQKFAGAKVISCHEINGEHNIIFQQENEVKSARFDASGKWIDTIISLNPGTEPAKIIEYLNAKHESKSGNIRRIENAQGTTYLAFISETKAIRFDKDGNMTKEEDVNSIDESALSAIK